jgi:hypothetical protein
MSGRPANKTYQYTTEGVFLQEYASESEVRSKYYSERKGKKPLFTRITNYTKIEYHLLPDNTYLFKERIGRVGVRSFNKRLNDEFIKLSSYNKAVKVYNLDNKEIARFVNMTIASKMTNIPIGTIHHSLYDGKQKFSHRGLIFKH